MAAVKLTLFTFLAVAFTYNPIFCAGAGAEGSAGNAEGQQESSVDSSPTGGAGSNNNAGGAPAPPPANPEGQQEGAVDNTKLIAALKVTDDGLKTDISTTSEQVQSKLKTQYTTYLGKINKEGNDEYFKDTKEKYDQLNNNIKAAIDAFKAADDWHTQVDAVLNSLSELAEFVQSVYDKANGNLKDDNVAKLASEMYKNKADTVRSLVGFYEAIMTRCSTEVTSAADVSEEIKTAITEAKTKFDELKNEIEDLVTKLNSEKDKAAEHFDELMYKMSEISEYAKTAYSKILENRDEKQVEYKKEIQHKLFNFISEAINISRSVIPGFFAIALSFLMVAL
uniref:Surface antigen 26 n=1 Tax=Babesia rodhaini TaxID=5870 RepID=Q17278_BABRO|nr:surface antigen 26 [Babesia rodhaini]prf//1413319A surface membrane protein 1 [Babesia rodhaini]